MAGKNNCVTVRRRGLMWSLDLSEGIDFSIYLLGAFERSTTITLEKLVKPGDVVFDLGANIGAHTVVLAQLVGGAGQVLAFEPQRILWGKNLAVFLIGTIELLIVVGIGAFVSQAWNFLLPALTVGFAGIAIVLGTGNFSSVFLPQRIREMQRGFRATGAATQGQGCLRAVLSIAMLAVSLVVLSPVALALALPLFFHAQWIWAFSIPGALIYGIAFHQAVSRLVAPRMLERTPEILAITTRE